MPVPATALPKEVSVLDGKKHYNLCMSVCIVWQPWRLLSPLAPLLAILLSGLRCEPDVIVQELLRMDAGEDTCLTPAIMTSLLKYMPDAEEVGWAAVRVPRCRWPQDASFIYCTQIARLNDPPVPRDRLSMADRFMHMVCPGRDKNTIPHCRAHKFLHRCMPVSHGSLSDWLSCCSGTRLPSAWLI